MRFAARFIAPLSLALLALASACTRDTAETPAGSHGHEAREVPRGPHGGRLLEKDGFQVEVTIYERGVPPQFRLYLFDEDKPLPPERATATIRLERLGGETNTFTFRPEGEYLVGDGVVEEPHSFDVSVDVTSGERKFAWTYDQPEGRVDMEDATAALAGITVETAGPRTLAVALDFPGETRLDGDRLAHVLARLPGVVTEVRKSLGDRVRKGDVLAILESRDLAEAQRELLEAHASLAFAKDALAREEGLLAQGVSSESDVLAKRRDADLAALRRSAEARKLEALGVPASTVSALAGNPAAALGRLELRSPFDGTVIEKEVSTGQAVSADAHLFSVADLSRVWVDVAVYAKDLPLVRTGQRVIVTSADLKSETTGTITWLGATIEPATRSTTARVVVPNPSGEWRAGLFVTARIVRDEVEVPVAVRTEALQTFRDWTVVFGRYGESFEVRPLELGRRDEEWVEVLSGLSAGERYASKNSFVIKADLGKSGASHDH